MYVKQDCHILFYRKLKKKNADGLVPLYARLTIDGLIEELSTGIRIHPDHWDQKEQGFTKDDPDRQLHDDAIGIRGLRPLTKKASSFLVMAVAGGAFCPPLMGFIADHEGMALAFLIPLFCFAFIAWFAYFVQKKKRLIINT
jgi:hypothetical protein